MFIGHFAVGLGLKKVAPRVSLGTLFLAAQFADLLWPTLLLLGIERVELAPGAAGPPLNFTYYPFSHSLLMVLVWSALFGTAYRLIWRYPAGAWVCAAAVLSHWLLDLVVHHPDLPLYPGGAERVGFGLWGSLPASLSVELLLFSAGTWLYWRSTRALDRIGSAGFWSLIGFLLCIHAANVCGAPPPSVAAVAWAGHAQWLLVLWGWWIDRHRSAVETQP
jgi:hypothetical protein